MKSKKSFIIGTVIIIAIIAIAYVVISKHNAGSEPTVDDSTVEYQVQ